MASITIHNHTYPFKEIERGAYTAATDYTKETLDFCRKWLQGVEKFVLTTSGSTGVPKPITPTRTQMLASVTLTDQALSLSQMKTALVCINTAYIGGKMMLVRGLEMGWEMTVVPPQANPFLVLNQPVDFIALVPLQLQAILKEDHTKAQFNRTKTVIVGGAAISFPLQQQITQLRPVIYHTYGMTETVSHIALKRLNGTQKQTYFQALQGVHLTQDQRGCLVIQAPTTLQKPIVTNDLVKLHSAQQFEILGRIDNIINSGGIKIQLEQIEAVVAEALQDLQKEVRFYAVGAPDTQLGQKLVLVIEHKTPIPFLEEKLKQQLPKYKVPKQIHYAEKLPETPSGKIKRLLITP
ncbi:MAG: AMP-binding protein [Thermonemataceae bacterium]